MSDWSKIVGNDISDFTNRWRRPLTGALLGAAGGYGLSQLAGVGGATNFIASNPALISTLGGLSGGAVGYSRDVRMRDKEDSDLDRIRQEQEKAAAGDDLLGIIGPYLPGSPDTPVPTDTSPVTIPSDPIAPDTSSGDRKSVV
jgi:hypothetical protein